jgi:hypothetical protein
MTRRCKQCKDVELKPARQCVDIVEKKGFCSIECLTQMTRVKIAKAEKVRRNKKNQADRQRIKPLSTICSEAQKDVNAMIRAVDELHGHACIATGRQIEHAGHYVHAGRKYRISWLRFFHANIHGQNGESNSKQAGDAVNYREGMVQRYGEQYVRELEDFKRCEDSGIFQAPTKDEVLAMAAWCRAMTRRYKKMQN